jgi:hypothetical protein
MNIEPFKQLDEPLSPCEDNVPVTWYWQSVFDEDYDGSEATEIFINTYSN